MRELTTGDIARVLKKYFPHITVHKVSYHARADKLKCHRQFGERGWNYPIIEEIPHYLKEIVGLMPDEIKEVMAELQLLNFNQHQLQLFAA